MGASSAASGGASVAIAVNAAAKGAEAIAIGQNAVAEAGFSQAIGANTKTLGNASLAIGDRASTGSAAGSSVAMGHSATAKAENAVALGSWSVADRANTVSVGFDSNKRQVVNVAKGTQDTDAVNVSQLRGVTSALGGGAGVVGDGAVTAPGYSVGGKKFNNVGDALGDIDGRVGGNTTAINNINSGAGIKYFRANSSDADAKASGMNSVSIGPASEASGIRSTALGSGSKATGDTSLAVGEKSIASGWNSAAFGRSATASAMGSTALGMYATASQTDSVALGAGSQANRINTISVGSESNRRQIVNVAKGTQDTDAVNVSQLKGVTSALGGGAGVAADGAVIAPGYNVGGKTHNNVGDALAAVDGRVTDIDGRVTKLGDQINNVSADGLVKQDLTSRDITVGKDSNGKKIDLKGTEGERVVTGVADGAIATGSKDVVNGGQLYNAEKATTDALGGGAKVNPDGTVSGPTYNVGGKAHNNVGDALAATDGRVTNVDGRVTQLGDRINNGEIGLVKQDPASRKITVAKDRDGTQVDFTGTAGTRVLNGVSKGAITPTSVEAVNGAQLYGTNKAVADSLGGGAKVNPDGTVSGPTYKVGDKSVGNVGDALTNLGDMINNVSADGLVKQDLTSRDITVGKDSNGKKIDLKGTEGERVVTGVADGVIATGSKDVVNGGQLYNAEKATTDALGGGAKVKPDGTVSGPTYNVGGKAHNNVGDALTTVDGRVTHVDGRVTTLGDQIAKGEIGLVKQDPSTKAVTVAKDTGGKLVDLKGTEGERVVTGVADGVIATGSKDVVNGGQLYAAEKATTDALGGGAKVNPDGTVSGPTYNVGGKAHNNVGDALTAADGRVTQLGDQINNGEIGLVKQDPASRKITVAKDRDGTQVDFTGTAGTRVLNGVSKGAITPTSVEAVNGAQLYGTNKTVADSLGGGAKVNPDGTVSGPTYKVGDKSVGNVGDALTNLGDMINNVSADGLVKQDLTSRDITVGKDSNGKKIDLKGTEGERVVTGVANGAVAKDGKDAVNGGQLYAAEKATTDALGGGAKVNPDGTVSGPTYNVGGKAHNNVGDALAAADGRVTNVDGRVSQLGDQINNGEIGLVKQDPASRKITVAKDRDGTQVDFTGTAGTRVLNGVSKGAITPTSVEAVNGAQLYGTNKAVADSLGGGAKVNPDGTVSGPTYKVGDKSVGNVGDALTNLGDMINNVSADGLVKQDLTSRDITVGKDSNGKKIDLKGTEGERVVTGVANGAVAKDGKDAVNGGQLYAAEKATTDALGGGAKVNPDGSVSGPTYKVGDKTVNNVGDAIDNIDGRVTNIGDTVSSINNGAGIKYFRANSSLADAVASGTDSIAMGPNASALAAGSVALGKGAVADRANTLSVGSASAQRQVVNVAKGTQDTDAVNVSQLKGVTDALGGGAQLKPDGSVTGPTYSVGGKSVTNVGDALTNLGDMINNVSADGLVKQDLTSRDITVGKDSNGKKIDLKGTEGERVVTGVADGAIATGSKDVVNGGQLYAAEKATTDALGGGAKVNPDGSVTGPTYKVGGKTVNNVGDAIDNVDGRVTSIDGRVTNLGDQVANGQIGLVQQDATSRKITVAKDRDGTMVDFAGTAGSRVLSGVSKGALTATSVEAVNGSQLYGTNKTMADSLGGGSKIGPDGSVTGPTYNVGGKTVTNVGDALTNLGDMINNVSADGLVKQDLTSRDITVGKDSNGKKIDLKGTEGERVVTGVANGTVGNDSKDAVNGGQLYAAEKATADALGGGAKVNPDGSVTGPTYSVGGKTVNNVGDALTEVDGRVTNVDARVTDLGDQVNGGKGIKYFRANSSLADAVASGMDSIAIGPMATAQAANAVALGKGAVANRANTVSVGAAGSERQVVNVAKGTQDTDAVNLSQLKPLANSLGGGAQVNPDGSVSGPTYKVGGKTVTTVGEAITNLGDMINNGTGNGPTLVDQDSASRDINVAAQTDGKRVTISGTQGDRVLAGVAKGAVTEASNEAVNGGQLHGVAKSVADGLGGGAKVNPDGSVTGPTYAVDGRTVNNAGDAITNLDGRVTHNAQAIKGITDGAGVKYFHANSSGADSVASGADSVAAGPAANASGDGSVAMGNGARAQADNSVALGAGSVAEKASTVSVGSKGNERTVSHVAAGQADTDAVNVSQLKNSQAGSIRYDAPAPGATPDYGSLSLGGPGGGGTTVVRNVGAGKAPTDAANVQQLQDGMAKTLGKAKSYTDSRFQQVKEDAWVARREARGGTAAAMAMAGMPQAYLPGANMLSAGVGSFQGESALAVGLSGVTDNGRYVYKAQASGNTRGDFGFSVGVGIQW
ncbi:YadA-like family protein [Stenotrophomonas panacihumi]